MNAQEHEQLTLFLNQLRDARVSEKNAYADALIGEAMVRNPDAAYLLVQRAMLVEQALNNAKAQIAQLQRQVQTKPGPDQSSFLGGRNPWAMGADDAQNQTRAPGAGNYPIPRAAPPLANAMGGPSFLGSVASTAAGVVAGSFLFHGIENLLGHHQTSSWLEPAGERVAEETTINNDYTSEPQDPWSQPDDNPGFVADDTNAFLDDGDDSTWV